MQIKEAAKQARLYPYCINPFSNTSAVFVESVNSSAGMQSWFDSSEFTASISFLLQAICCMSSSTDCSDSECLIAIATSPTGYFGWNYEYLEAGYKLKAPAYMNKFRNHSKTLKDIFSHPIMPGIHCMILLLSSTQLRTNGNQQQHNPSKVELLQSAILQEKDSSKQVDL